MAISRFDIPRQPMQFEPLSMQEMAYAPSLLRQREDVLQEKVDVAADTLGDINIQDPDVQNVVGKWDKQLSDISQEMVKTGYTSEIEAKYRNLSRQYSQDIKPVQTYISARQQASQDYNKLARDPSKYIEGTSPGSISYAAFREDPNALQNYQVFDKRQVRQDAQGVAKRLVDMAVAEPGFIKKNIPGLDGYMQIAQQKGFSAPEAVAEWLATDPQGQSFLDTNLQSHGYSGSGAMSDLFTQELVNYGYKAPDWKVIQDRDYITDKDKLSAMGKGLPTGLVAETGFKAFNIDNKDVELPIVKQAKEDSFKTLKGNYPLLKGITTLEELDAVSRKSQVRARAGAGRAGGLEYTGTREDAMRSEQAIKLRKDIEANMDAQMKDYKIKEYAVDRTRALDSKTRTTITNLDKALEETLRVPKQMDNLVAMSSDNAKFLKKLKDAEIDPEKVNISFNTLTKPTTIGKKAIHPIYNVTFSYKDEGGDDKSRTMDITTTDGGSQIRSSINRAFGRLEGTGSFEMAELMTQAAPIVQQTITSNPTATVRQVLSQYEGSDNNVIQAVGFELAKAMGITPKELKDYADEPIGR